FTSRIMSPTCRPDLDAAEFGLIRWIIEPKLSLCSTSTPSSKRAYRRKLPAPSRYRATLSSRSSAADRVRGGLTAKTWSGGGGLVISLYALLTPAILVVG